MSGVITSTLTKSLPSIVFVCIIYFIAWNLAGNPYLLLVMIFLLITLWDMGFHIVTKKTPQPKVFAKNMFVTVVFIGGVLLLSKFLGGYGLVGMLIVAALICGFVLYKRRGAYKFWIEHIEETYIYKDKEE